MNSCSLLSKFPNNGGTFDLNSSPKGQDDVLIFNHERLFSVTYPASNNDKDLTTPPYVQVYASADKTKLIINGTGDEGAVIHIDDGIETYITHVWEGIFETEIPYEQYPVHLKISAKISGHKRSNDVIVTNELPSDS